MAKTSAAKKDKVKDTVDQELHVSDKKKPKNTALRRYAQKMQKRIGC